MEITNKDNFNRHERIRRLLILLTAGIIVVSIFWYGSLSANYLYAAVGLIALCLALLVYYALGGLAFFSFEKVGDILIFKYYSTGNFRYKRMKITIPQADFVGYQITSSYGGLRNNLLLTEKMKGRMAAYPPLSITFLSSIQKQQLQQLLDKASHDR